MNSSTHPVTREEVMALQDGELAGKEWEAVAGHVAFCRECNEFLKEMEETGRELRSWRVGELSEEVERRVLEAAKDRANGIAGKRQSESQKERWSFRRWVMVAGGCAAAVLLALAVSVPNLLRSRMATNMAPPVASNRRAELSADGVPRDVSKYAWAAQTSMAMNSDTQSDDESATAGLASAKRALAEEEIRQGPMIAQSVELAVTAKDVSAARSAVEGILARHHGYAAGLTVNTEQNGPRSLEASLRIPARELLAAMAELKALGAVQTETQKGEEVTQQHADLVARLKNSRETEKRLQAILQQRTGKIADVLAVEQEIARVRGDIEQMEAEQTSVEHRVDFATIELHLSEEYKEQLGTGKLSTGRRLRNAAVTGLRDAYENLLGAIVFVMSAAPTLLLWVVVLFFPARWIWMKRQRWMWGTRKVAVKA
jgi:Domain of unknown function (DUF4349)